MWRFFFLFLCSYIIPSRQREQLKIIDYQTHENAQLSIRHGAHMRECNRTEVAEQTNLDRQYRWQKFGTSQANLKDAKGINNNGKTRFRVKRTTSKNHHSITLHYYHCCVVSRTLNTSSIYNVFPWGKSCAAIKIQISPK